MQNKPGYEITGGIVPVIRPFPLRNYKRVRDQAAVLDNGFIIFRQKIQGIESRPFCLRAALHRIKRIDYKNLLPQSGPPRRRQPRKLPFRINDQNRTPVKQ